MRMTSPVSKRCTSQSDSDSDCSLCFSDNINLKTSDESWYSDFTITVGNRIFKYRLIDGDYHEGLVEDAVHDFSEKYDLPYDFTEVLFIHCSWKIDNISDGVKEMIRRKMIAENADISDLTLSVVASAEKSVCEVCQSSCILYSIGCSHFFCKACWVQYINTKLEDKTLPYSTCMNLGCCYPLTRSLASELTDGRLSTNVLHKIYSDQLKMLYPFTRKCPKCCSVYYMTERYPLPLTCKVCHPNFTFCFCCGFPYHAPSTCEMQRRWQAILSDDSQSGVYLNLSTKECPNCFRVIDKDGGCNHMQCSMCHHEFCWICLMPYNGSHSCLENLAGNDDVNFYGRLDAYLKLWFNNKNSLELSSKYAETHTDFILSVFEQRTMYTTREHLNDVFETVRKARETVMFSYVALFFSNEDVKSIVFENFLKQLVKNLERLSYCLENSIFESIATIDRYQSVVETKRKSILDEFWQSYL